ncbi:hepatitis A virus cellular receptor 2 homolog [Suncus etruscus]|uniref:hepatitis A virus cellular receptor 2 homolog n=1 Tax=Suncus etruscus TaxID=109475 RepID=UPI00211001F4|nr:hepatitis A virus cellular receptor 2 homolog [Suncus etruscus]
MRPGPLLTSGESCTLFFTAAKPRGSLLPFAWVLLWMLQLIGSAVEREYKVELGQDAHLSCEYSPPEPPTPLVPVCWGRGTCPLSNCQRLLLRTNGRSVQQRVHRRYQLKGQLCQGDVSLTIQGTWLNDSGTYCCHIQFPGPINDKVILKLTVTPAEVVPAMTMSSHFTDTFPSRSDIYRQIHGLLKAEDEVVQLQKGGEYAIYKDAPMFESDFIQVSKKGK